MSAKTTFFRISSVVALLALVAVLVFAGGSTQASPALQATAAASAMSTMSVTTTTDGAIPPCPQNMMMATMSATMSSTMQAMSGTPSMAATMNAAMPTTSATMSAAATMNAAAPGASATMAPTMSMAMPTTSATMAATMYVMPGMTMSGCALTATLMGSNEVPKAGDPNGTGTAMVLISRPATGPGEICFSIHVSGIKLPATASHIHSGAAGVPGPVIVPFQAPDASGNSSGCTENVDRTLIASILAQPGNYYVNVHNADFPAGAMRGQLTAASQ